MECRKLLRRWERSWDVRFITFSTYRRLPLLHNPAIMDLFSSSLSESRLRHGVRLYAWVVMPEHVHLLLMPAAGPWSQFATALKTQISKDVLGRWRDLRAPVLSQLRVPDSDRHRFWQHGGGFDRNVRSSEEFSKHVRYIHRNPVERGLVDTPEAWKWSSVRWWMGSREGEWPCDPPPGKNWESWRGYV